MCAVGSVGCACSARVLPLGVMFALIREDICGSACAAALRGSAACACVVCVSISQPIRAKSAQ